MRAIEQSAGFQPRRVGVGQAGVVRGQGSTRRPGWQLLAGRAGRCQVAPLGVHGRCSGAAKLGAPLCRQKALAAGKVVMRLRRSRRLCTRGWRRQWALSSPWRQRRRFRWGGQPLVWPGVLALAWSGLVAHAAARRVSVGGAGQGWPGSQRALGQRWLGVHRFWVRVPVLGADDVTEP